MMPRVVELRSLIWLTPKTEVMKAHGASARLNVA